jgi:hypothetical protein
MWNFEFNNTNGALMYCHNTSDFAYVLRENKDNLTDE